MQKIVVSGGMNMMNGVGMLWINLRIMIQIS